MQFVSFELTSHLFLPLVPPVGQVGHQNTTQIGKVGKGHENIKQLELCFLWSLRLHENSIFSFVLLPVVLLTGYL